MDMQCRYGYAKTKIVAVLNSKYPTEIKLTTGTQTFIKYILPPKVRATTRLHINQFGRKKRWERV